MRPKSCLEQLADTPDSLTDCSISAHLHRAVRNGDFKLVCLLLDHAKKVGFPVINIKNLQGQTCLDICSEAQASKKMVQELLDHGAVFSQKRKPRVDTEMLEYELISAI